MSLSRRSESRSRVVTIHLVHNHKRVALAPRHKQTLLSLGANGGALNGCQRKMRALKYEIGATGKVPVCLDWGG